ncbi:MAG TPA: hypothetical protein VK508_18800 [Cyclobacteriaceae bacterium]|nr:hypothetical protein [Cyclobacteriaceae bacterium]
MKKIVLAVVAILLVMTGRTQSFEGSIRWTMKMDITDPKAKAQMEEAKKKAADPANQAKMKEMTDKMNDPQFKAMLDANPQMKAQMEAMMKMMAGGDLSGMLPSAIIMKLKGQNSLVSIQGGIMDKTDMLHLADKDETFTINHNAKTFTLMPKNDGEKRPKPKVTKTSETAKILNYNCTKYIIEITIPEGKTMTSNYWATNEIKDIDLKAIAKQQMAKDQSFVFPEIDGFPLRIESQIPQTGTITIETAEIKRGGVANSDLQLPSGYTEAKL